MVSFTLRRFHLRIDRSLGVSQSRPEPYGGRKTSVHPGNQTQISWSYSLLPNQYTRWAIHQDLNNNLIPQSSSQLCRLPRKFSVIYLGGKNVQTYGLQMTELAVKICGFYICDREIGSAANAAQWWWYGAPGVVHWSAEAKQGSLPLGTGRGDSNAAFKDWYQLSDPLRSFIYRGRMSCEKQHPLWHNL